MAFEMERKVNFKRELSYAPSGPGIHSFTACGKHLSCASNPSARHEEPTEERRGHMHEGWNLTDGNESTAISQIPSLEIIQEKDKGWLFNVQWDLKHK